MFGSVKFEDFKGLTAMPQKAASAWSALDGLVGASYKPLVFVGTQPVKGTNYLFIAEQTITAYPIVRRIVTVTINEYEGKYTVVPESIRVIVA